MAVSQYNDGLSGGPPRFFTVEEPEAGILIVGTCVRGISRSTDGGATWQPVDGLDHISINTFATDETDGVLAATSGGLYRSNDHGASWRQIDDDPIYATVASGTDRPSNLTTVRLLKLNDGRVLAGTDGAGIWARTNGEWATLGADCTTVYSLAETSSGAILAGTSSDGMLRSDNGSATWVPSSHGLPDVCVHCLLVLDDGATLLAGTGLGVSRSTDDGRTWGPYAEELYGYRIFSLRQLSDGSIAAGSYTHLWIGADDSWRQVDPGLTTDEAWSIQFQDNTIYAGTKAGVLRSRDHGKTFENVAPGSVVYTLALTSTKDILAGGDGGVRISPDWTSVGDLGRRAWALFEIAPDHLLAGTLTEGLYQYQHGTWGPLPGGPLHWQIYQVIRSTTGRLLAGTGAIIDGRKVGSVFTSDDDGQSWAETLSGRSYYRLTQTSDGTIYAGGRRSFISASTDDGDTWELRPLPLGQEGKMYSLVADSNDRLFLGSGGLLLRSDDAAQTWIILDAGIDGVSVYDLREGPDGLLAAATSAGIFTSTDGGDTWDASELH